MADAATSDASYDFAVTVAQIFSGVTFTLVATWLTFSNSVSLAYIQRASLEKRLTVCCFVNTYIALFSCFFNFFQLTKVDDLVLPEQNNYTIDLARPIMWIATCPLMQLCLVILGGSKVPEYRRALMPALSVLVLLFGLVSTYFRNTWRFAFYFLGLATAGAMFGLNAKQITEHSDGQENFFSGDSEYRKATLLVIILWLPFPIWYLLSPEGLSLVNDQLLIQVGWSFLSLTAKFSFIFYVQKMKDNYCTKLKTKREMYQPSGKKNELDGDLTAVLIETLNFLGMAQHNDRIINLFAKADITTAKAIEALSYEQSKEKMVPWDVVHAVQQRLRVWRLEATDNAEMQMKDGENHYKAKKPQIDDNASTTSSFVYDDGPEELSGGTPEGEDLPLALPLGSRPASAKSKNSTASKVKRMGHEQVGLLADKIGHVDTKLQHLVHKIDGHFNSQIRGSIEEETNLLSKIEGMIQSSEGRTEQCVMSVGGTLRKDLQVMAGNTQIVAEQIANSNRAQEDTMADMRRQHMMLMELVSSDRDNINTKISDINSAISGRMMDSNSLSDVVRSQVQAFEGRSDTSSLLGGMGGMGGMGGIGMGAMGNQDRMSGSSVSPGYNNMSSQSFGRGF